LFNSLLDSVLLKNSILFNLRYLYRQLLRSHKMWALRDQAFPTWYIECVEKKSKESKQKDSERFFRCQEDHAHHEIR